MYKLHDNPNQHDCWRSTVQFYTGQEIRRTVWCLNYESHWLCWCLWENSKLTLQDCNVNCRFSATGEGEFPSSPYTVRQFSAPPRIRKALREIPFLLASALPADAMVVCKCRKATKLYCFVHKVPVCGECICSPEHRICVVRTYSDWVIDGEYDWPPTCCLCKAVLEDGTETQTTRLGCLHVIHTSCLVSHIKSFPQHTAPAGYMCPLCNTTIWPPKMIKDTGSHLHSKLKEAILQTGLEKNLFGNHPFLMPASESRTPPAFALDPLVSATEGKGKNNPNSLDPPSHPSMPSSGMTGTSMPRISIDIVEVDSLSSVGSQFQSGHEPNFMKTGSPAGPGATTRKVAYHAERQNSGNAFYSDDEDGTGRKYSRRGPIRHKFLRALLPFWSSALPSLPVTAPPRKDVLNSDDVPEGRSRHQRPSRMDPRRILLVVAIMACVATMGILYYRLAQQSLGESLPDDEQ